MGIWRVLMDYDAWDKDYKENKEAYLKIFDDVMSSSDIEDCSALERQIHNSVAVASATDALQFSLQAYDIGPGDEVLVSNFSWISTASCITMVGATPVFCDIDEDYHISLDSIKRMLSSKTKALVYTHLFGNMSDMSEIVEFCKTNKIILIEDAAQSYGSSLHGIEAGTIGDISSFSFNSNKVISGINGGGVVITRNKQDIIHKLRRHGNGEMLGRNSKMYRLNSEIIAYRLQKEKYYKTRRQEIAKLYDEWLSDQVIVQKSKPGLVHNYHKYVVQVDNQDTRDSIVSHLGLKIHYPNILSSNKCFHDNMREDNCVKSSEVANTIFSLPIHPWVTHEEIDDMCSKIEMLL
jgi:dTDP-4-amino-4,6-dideoxygalactose transaminase